MRCRPRLMLSYTATSISLADIVYQSRMIISATGCKQVQLLRAQILWLSNNGSPPQGLFRRRNWHLACLDVLDFQ